MMKIFMTFSVLILCFVIHGVLTGRLQPSSRIILDKCFQNFYSHNCSEDYEKVISTVSNKWCCIKFIYNEKNDEEALQHDVMTSSGNNNENMRTNIMISREREYDEKITADDTKEIYDEESKNSMLNKTYSINMNEAIHDSSLSLNENSIDSQLNIATDGDDNAESLKKIDGNFKSNLNVDEKENELSVAQMKNDEEFKTFSDNANEMDGKNETEGKESTENSNKTEEESMEEREVLNKEIVNEFHRTQPIGSEDFNNDVNDVHDLTLITRKFKDYNDEKASEQNNGRFEDEKTLETVTDENLSENQQSELNLDSSAENLYKSLLPSENSEDLHENTNKDSLGHSEDDGKLEKKSKKNSSKNSQKIDYSKEENEALDIEKNDFNESDEILKNSVNSNEDSELYVENSDAASVYSNKKPKESEFIENLKAESKENLSNNSVEPSESHTKSESIQLIADDSNQLDRANSIDSDASGSVELDRDNQISPDAFVNSSVDQINDLIKKEKNINSENLSQEHEILTDLKINFEEPNQELDIPGNYENDMAKSDNWPDNSTQKQISPAITETTRLVGKKLSDTDHFKYETSNDLESETSSKIFDELDNESANTAISEINEILGEPGTNFAQTENNEEISSNSDSLQFFEKNQDVNKLNLAEINNKSTDLDTETSEIYEKSTESIKNSHEILTNLPTTIKRRKINRLNKIKSEEPGLNSTGIPPKAKRFKNRLINKNFKRPSKNRRSDSRKGQLVKNKETTMKIISTIAAEQFNTFKAQKDVENDVEQENNDLDSAKLHSENEDSQETHSSLNDSTASSVVAVEQHDDVKSRRHEDIMNKDSMKLTTNNDDAENESSLNNKESFSENVSIETDFNEDNNVDLETDTENMENSKATKKSRQRQNFKLTKQSPVSDTNGSHQSDNLLENEGNEVEDSMSEKVSIDNNELHYVESDDDKLENTFDNQIENDNGSAADVELNEDVQRHDDGVKGRQYSFDIDEFKVKKTKPGEDFSSLLNTRSEQKESNYVEAVKQIGDQMVDTMV